jgi:hypothetical protein
MFAITVANRTRFSSPDIREIPTESYTLQHLRSAQRLIAAADRGGAPRFKVIAAASRFKVIAEADDGGRSRHSPLKRSPARVRNQAAPNLPPIIPPSILDPSAHIAI